jgi:PAT family beta-lactamase induction signal transducer AmpG
MSSLTNIGYTATQYALLSSFYALLGKVLKGMSGWAVEHLEVGRTLLEAYALFFTATALMGIPALLLCILLARRRPAAAPAASIA